jgi:hypothetical protein
MGVGARELVSLRELQQGAPLEPVRGESQAGRYEHFVELAIAHLHGMFEMAER